ncbi:MAG: DUF5666 domain-containing protein [Candidatus Acidiferrales bacterium]
MRKAALATAIMLAFAFAVFAHGTDKHVIGTVTKLSEAEITVQTQDNQLQVVKIAPDTSFVKSGAASSIKELKVGDRVVIHAKPVGNDLIAHEVRFGKPAQPAAKSAAKSE